MKGSSFYEGQLWFVLLGKCLKALCYQARLKTPLFFCQPFFFYFISYLIFIIFKETVRGYFILL